MIPTVMIKECHIFGKWPWNVLDDGEQLEMLRQDVPSDQYHVVSVISELCFCSTGV